MTDEPGRDDLSTLAALGDPSRRALYDFIVGAGCAVSRDEAAAAVGLERGTATHHLERLASDGLLQVEYRRLTGRQGPGAGRPAKLYRRADRQFDVSLPPRDSRRRQRRALGGRDEEDEDVGRSRRVPPPTAETSTPGRGALLT